MVALNNSLTEDWIEEFWNLEDKNEWMKLISVSPKPFLKWCDYFLPIKKRKKKYSWYNIFDFFFLSSYTYFLFESILNFVSFFFLF